IEQVSTAMKKANKPLRLDLPSGGFEVFPLAKLFDLPSNVWYPSILIRENLLAEPFAAWAANVFYTLGGVQILQWTDAAFFYAPTANWLRPDHFVQRLTPAKVQAIISRVIRNAESANADPSRDFIIESLGIFGSVLADAILLQATSMLCLPPGGVPTTPPCPRLHIILLTLVNQPTAFHARSHAAAEEWT